MKNILKIIFFTIIFTVVINYSFFGFKKNNIENQIIEEIYIEPESKEIPIYQEIVKQNEIISSELINYYKKSINTKYSFYYFPRTYKKDVEILKNNIEEIILRNIFFSKIKNIDIILVKEKIDRRGKMRNKKIKLYGANNENVGEYIAIFIHELGHYIDLYFLEKKTFLDISEKFYEISWIETKIKKPNMKIEDFVSGYSMTNKYEDFGESFTYYILHNKDFFEKSKKSEILKKKYEFFGDYIFKNKEFFMVKFNNEIPKDYYRDTTKIKFKKDEFINYLKNLKN